MGIDNPSFEIVAGDSVLTQESVPYEASDWTLVENATGVELINFGEPGYIAAAERFERGWDNSDFVFAFISPGYDIDWFLFNQMLETTVFEGFEVGWNNNEDFQFTLVRTEECPFTFIGDGQGIDSFEEGWDNNENFIFEFSDSDLEAAFNAEDFESSSWVGTYLFFFQPSNLEAVDFTIVGGTEEFETFRDISVYEYWIDVEGAAGSTATYTITVRSHPVSYQADSGDSLQDIRNALVDQLNGIGGVKALADGSDVNRLWLGAEDPATILNPEYDFIVKAEVTDNAGADNYFTVQWLGNDEYWHQSVLMRTI